MTLIKTWTTEDEYVAKKEIKRRRQLAEDLQLKQKEDEQKASKELHWMKCPKCGFDLEEIEFNEVLIDKCFQCNGFFLDDGEFEKLAGGNFIDRIIKSFK